MPFTEEIRQAAENLGKQLGTDSSVQGFVSLRAKIQQDAEVVDLENTLAHLYHKLGERQQNGEVLERTELDKYYQIRERVRSNPFISARDKQHELVKLVFADAGQTMTSVLGIDFAELAL